MNAVRWLKLLSQNGNLNMSKYRILKTKWGEYYIEVRYFLFLWKPVLTQDLEIALFETLEEAEKVANEWVGKRGSLSYE